MLIFRNDQSRATETVRILLRQPVFGKGIFAKIRSVAKRRDGGFRQNSPRVFEIQKKRAGREAGVLCSPNSQNSNFVSQSGSEQLSIFNINLFL